MGKYHWLVLFALVGCGGDDATVAPDGALPDGTALAAALTIGPTPGAFGSVTVFESSPVMTFVVVNTGDADTGAITFDRTGDDGFLLDGTDCDALAPGAQCEIAVRFTPEIAGAATATLDVTSESDAAASTTMTGTGVDAGVLEISASTNQLGTVDTGALSATTAVFTVTNTGELATGTLRVTPFGDADFVKSADTCDGEVLTGGSECSFRISFAPVTPGAKAATFDVTATPGNAVTGAVSGTATESLTITPATTAAFGTVPLGLSAARTFTVTNTAPTASGTLVADADGAGYAITDDGCTGGALLAAATCEVTVTLDPAAAGGYPGALHVRAAPGGIPHLALTGAAAEPGGTAPTAITLTPASVAENLGIGATVGTLGATDADAGDTFTFALVPGTGATDNAAFTIAGAELRTAAVFDREAAATRSIRVRVTDSGGQVLIQPVSVAITNVDEPPVAVGDAAAVPEDAGAIAILVLANDADADAGSIAIVSATQPANGLVFITGGGTGLTYEPAANYCVTGTALDTFTYTLAGGSSATVAMTVVCVDDRPFAVADSQSLFEDASSVPINVLANDTDVDGGSLAITSFTGLRAQLVGTVLFYTPLSNFCGSDTLTYTLNGGSMATVNVTVTCVDDAPVHTVPTIQTTNEDTTLVFSVVNLNQLGVLDVDTASIRSIVTVDNGTFQLGTTAGVAVTGNNSTLVTVVGTPGNVAAALLGARFVPAANYAGAATLTLASGPSSGGGATDADSIALTIAAVPDAPTLSGTCTSPYLIGDPATTVDSCIILADEDVDDSMVSAIVQLTTPRPGDVLAVTPGPGLADISGAYDPTLQRLILVSHFGATVAHWQAALRAVKFSTTGAPAERSITFVVDDGEVRSATFTVTLPVDAPPPG